MGLFSFFSKEKKERDAVGKGQAVNVKVPVCVDAWHEGRKCTGAVMQYEAAKRAKRST